MDCTTILIILMVCIFIVCVILGTIFCIYEGIRCHRLWKKHDEYFKHGYLKKPKHHKRKKK